MYKPIVPIILKGLKQSNTHQIVDLGSGGGGGLIWLSTELRKVIPDLKIILTDLYPNLSAFEFTKQQADNFEYIAEPIDARNVPAALPGLRTQFLSLHHFMPADARQILQNAVNSDRPIAIFEAQERSVPSILAMILSPLSVFLTTPFIRPFKLGRLVFTYLVPIVPLFVLWDGIVSSLRTYSVREMKDLVSKLSGAEMYHWEIDRMKFGPGVVLYLLGTKTRTANV